jgi:V/A-type H+-transporting ATPase subunit E
LELSSELTKVMVQVQEILTVKERETKAEVTELLTSVQRQSETLKRQIVGNAEMAVRNKSLQIVDEAVNKVFNTALQRLSTDKGNNSEALIEKLLLESIDVISTSGDLIVSGRSSDLQLLQKVVKNVANEKKIRIVIDEKPIKGVGGLKVRAADGSVSFDNTFEARLERIKPSLRKEVASLFTLRMDV